MFPRGGNSNQLVSRVDVAKFKHMIFIVIPLFQTIGRVIVRVLRLCLHTNALYLPVRLRTIWCWRTRVWSRLPRSQDIQKRFLKLDDSMPKHLLDVVQRRD